VILGALYNEMGLKDINVATVIVLASMFMRLKCSLVLENYQPSKE
jgi:hypothetical protein